MEIALVGIVVSLLVQWLKSMTNLGEYKTLGVVLLVSLLGAWGYTFLVAAGYWQSVLAVLLTAGSFYTYIIARFQTKPALG